MNAMFKLDIEIAGSAFDDGAELEIARILSSTAKALLDNRGVPDEMTLRDLSGNTVGRAWIEEGGS